MAKSGAKLPLSDFTYQQDATIIVPAPRKEQKDKTEPLLTAEAMVPKGATYQGADIASDRDLSSASSPPPLIPKSGQTFSAIRNHILNGGTQTLLEVLFGPPASAPAASNAPAGLSDSSTSPLDSLSLFGGSQSAFFSIESHYIPIRDEKETSPTAGWFSFSFLNCCSKPDSAAVAAQRAINLASRPLPAPGTYGGYQEERIERDPSVQSRKY